MKIKLFSVASAVLVCTVTSFAHGSPTPEEIVRTAQQALVEQGYDPGPIDGEWKPKTEAALKRAQLDREFEPTGEVDQRTLASLGVPDAENPFMRETRASASAGPSQAEPSSR